mmetsp:Transcript_30824/g.92449  ORF Transcript_30824/g.92449 Transcript_30824/m.92449 type:complete len:310 (-) Transcript_30824:255-1184(-)
MRPLRWRRATPLRHQLGLPVPRQRSCYIGARKSHVRLNDPHIFEPPANLGRQLAVPQHNGFSVKSKPCRCIWHRRRRSCLEQPGEHGVHLFGRVRVDRHEVVSVPSAQVFCRVGGLSGDSGALGRDVETEGDAQRRGRRCARKRPVGDAVQHGRRQCVPSDEHSSRDGVFPRSANITDIFAVKARCCRFGGQVRCCRRMTPSMPAGDRGCYALLRDQILVHRPLAIQTGIGRVTRDDFTLSLLWQCGERHRVVLQSPSHHAAARILAISNDVNEGCRGHEGDEAQQAQPGGSSPVTRPDCHVEVQPLST